MIISDLPLHDLITIAKIIGIEKNIFRIDGISQAELFLQKEAEACLTAYFKHEIKELIRYIQNSGKDTFWFYIYCGYGVSFDYQELLSGVIGKMLYASVFNSLSIFELITIAQCLGISNYVKKNDKDEVYFYIQTETATFGRFESYEVALKYILSEYIR